MINEKLKEKYGVREKNKNIFISNPAYIKIKNGYIEESIHVWYIKNDEVCVSLWKEIYNMHVTVY